MLEKGLERHFKEGFSRVSNSNTGCDPGEGLPQPLSPDTPLNVYKPTLRRGRIQDRIDNVLQPP